MQYRTKEERAELNKLSFEIFNVKSAWQKILKSGVVVPYKEPGFVGSAIYYVQESEIKQYLLALKNRLEEERKKFEESKKIQQKKSKE